MTKARVVMLFAALALSGQVVLSKQAGDISKLLDMDGEREAQTQKVVFWSGKKKHSKDADTKKIAKSKKIKKSKSRSRVARSKKATRSAVAVKSVPTSAVCFKNGDGEFKIGGDATVENFYHRNAFLLNDKLPDENFYFRHTLDLNFDYVYGQKKFNHKAVEAYLNLRHRGIWGRSQSYADRDSVFSDKATVSIADARTGGHTHASGRVLPWISEAWLQASFNAMFGLNSENVHSIKLGWFPFDLGHGIALGRWYGNNRAILGVYNYDKEDKWVPGININGQLIKDKLSYDLYYGKLEERSKSLSDNIDIIRTQWLDKAGIKWRGTHKDNDLYAARLKWKAFKNDDYGTLDLEPYIYYNNAKDQWYEFEPDTNMQFGAYGLSAEYAISNFEFGAEVAANYGDEKVVALDRNKIELAADANGAVTEYYSHILTNDPATTNYSAWTKSPVNAASKAVAANTARNNGVAVGGAGLYNAGLSTAVLNNPAQAQKVYDTPTAANRFRPAYTNKLNGWMFVTDAAYKLPDYNLKFAVSYGYASGDANPHEDERSKTYKGFIGINESYCGNRVPSIFLLDRRFLKVPSALTRNSDELVADLAFTDMHLLGAGATWTPAVGGKKVTVNPNVIFFWKDSASKKVILGAGGPNDWQASQTENASKYMGSELNLVTECELLKDLKVFGKFAMFIPGSFFTDVAGIQLDDDFFKYAYKVNPNYNPKDFRLGHDTAYYANVGLGYKF